MLEKGGKRRLSKAEKRSLHVEVINEFFASALQCNATGHSRFVFSKPS
jgi:hypothetical protein